MPKRQAGRNLRILIGWFLRYKQTTGEVLMQKSFQETAPAQAIAVALGGNTKGKILCLQVTQEAGSDGTHAAFWGDPYLE